MVKLLFGGHNGERERILLNICIYDIRLFVNFLYPAREVGTSSGCEIANHRKSATMGRSPRLARSLLHQYNKN